jgi:hypothetical protein
MGARAKLLARLGDEPETQIRVVAIDLERRQAAGHVPGQQAVLRPHRGVDRRPVEAPRRAQVEHVGVQPGREAGGLRDDARQLGGRRAARLGELAAREVQVRDRAARQVTCGRGGIQAPLRRGDRSQRCGRRVLGLGHARRGQAKPGGGQKLRELSAGRRSITPKPKQPARNLEPFGHVPHLLHSELLAAADYPGHPRLGVPQP